jgi:hypothetical protein
MADNNTNDSLSATNIAQPSKIGRAVRPRESRQRFRYQAQVVRYRQADSLAAIIHSENPLNLYSRQIP